MSSLGLLDVLGVLVRLEVYTSDAHTWQPSVSQQPEWFSCIRSEHATIILTDNAQKNPASIVHIRLYPPSPREVTTEITEGYTPNGVDIWDEVI